jgi:hypothetical protein
MPLRRHNVDHPAGLVLEGGIVQLHLQRLGGIERRQIVEMDLVLDLLGSSKLIAVTFSRAK